MALKVRLSIVLILKEVQFITLAHNVNVRVKTPEELKVQQVTVCQFVSKVHILVEILAEPLLNASCNVHPPPDP